MSGREREALRAAHESFMDAYRAKYRDAYGRGVLTPTHNGDYHDF